MLPLLKRLNKTYNDRFTTEYDAKRPFTVMLRRFTVVRFDRPGTIDSQTTTPIIDSIDVKAFGLNQKLFSIWFKNNIQQLKINEDNHNSIEDILFLYIDSNEDDNHVDKIIAPDYEEVITNVIFNKELSAWI
ncbi:unnamed protein product [Rotaria magnacalcarata]|nr:unnamed protein product [Rotaria magnacalcarata]CAF4238260.1 unnamed protein product [Rotaria magnacalcarata]CAF4390469.1 unnamed protein product [Rotaria magnacalcarata]CAF4445449.1 unnamed protein product [Rotaria magnacalcarata]